jgi:hypothetical protein
MLIGVNNCFFQVKIALYSLGRKTLFGTGNLEVLKDRIRRDKRITAVFISTDVLRGLQHRYVIKLGCVMKSFWAISWFSVG